MSVTWSDVTNGAGGLVKCVKAVCTSGTETFGAAATDGLNLEDCVGYDVVLEADSGQTLSGAGTLQAYVYDPQVAGWARAPDFDITVPAGAASNRRFYPLAGSPGKGIPVLVAQGRIGYTPNGVTVSSGGVTIYLDPIGA